MSFRLRFTDLFYNLVDALIMARYASALVKLGFSLEQIGFFVLSSLDSQPFAIRCLLEHKLNLSKEELEKLSIGSEYKYKDKHFGQREVIIRGGLEIEKEQMEKELAMRR